VILAIDEADVILFMVDIQSGITDLDKEVAQVLRQSSKTVFVVANKADNPALGFQAAEFYGLGMGDLFPISASNGSGSGDLLDAVAAALPNQEVAEETDELPRLAVVGRPNAGKSSFINALLGIDRNIVTPVAGTTRDSIETRYNAFGFDFYLVDTAGLRKKSKVHEDLEFYSVMRSVRSIEHADVCLLMVDATEGFTVQDLNIFALAQKNKKGIVILVNKWDLVKKDTLSTKRFEEEIRERISPFSDVEIVFTSVVQKQRLLKALELAVRTFENKHRKIKTSELNDFLLPLVQSTPPPAIKGKYIKIKYVTQLPTPFPSFALFANLPQYIKEPYKRFVENKLRERFNFRGVPIQVFFRQK